MMMKIEREGPAATENTLFTFSNFFEATRADFKECAIPDREPDFISNGRSVYWNEGSGVIRASDHWSERSGCLNIASCYWTYTGAWSPGRWESGYCDFKDFRKRGRHRRFLPASDLHLSLLDHLDPHEATISVSEVTRIFGKDIPNCLMKVLKGTIAAEPARGFFARHPSETHVYRMESVAYKALKADGLIFDGWESF